MNAEQRQCHTLTCVRRISVVRGKKEERSLTDDGKSSRIRDRDFIRSDTNEFACIVKKRRVSSRLRIGKGEGCEGKGAKNIN